MYKYVAPLGSLVCCDLHEKSLASLQLTCCSCKFLHLGCESRATMLRRIPVVLDWAGRVAAGIYFHILKVISTIVRAGFVKLYARDQTNYKLALKPRSRDATQKPLQSLG